MAGHLLNSCRNCPAMTVGCIKEKMKSTTKHKQSHRYLASESRNQENTPSNQSDDQELEFLSVANSDCSNSSNISLSSIGEASSSRSTRLQSFCDTMSMKDAKTAQTLLAKAIYASGTPLSITENRYWVEYHKFLRPSFNLPTKFQLSNSILTETFKKVSAEVQKKVDSAVSLGLQCDGWSNIRREGIMNFLITTPQPVFYKTLATSTNAHTGEYLAEEMAKVIDSVGAEKVLGIVTDNAANMKCAWQILATRYEGDQISFYGCAAHTLNLVIRDIMKLPTVDVLVTHATSIVRAIKESHVISATFGEIQANDENKVCIALKIPVKTRWGSIVGCFESVLSNKHNLQALAIAPKVQDKIKKSIKALILGEEFWTGLLRMVTLLKPLAVWITALEGDTPKISHVPKAFSELRKHFENELEKTPLAALTAVETKQAFDALDKRSDMALRPIHYAANILDPSCRGKHLTSENHVTGCSLVYDLAKKFHLNSDQVLLELTDYDVQEGIFAQEFVQRSAEVNPARVWWKSVCKGTELAKLASQILSLPATSAATERSFSTYGWIHSAKRNRLSEKRAGMITYIAHNLKLLDNQPLQTEKSQHRDVGSLSLIHEENEDEMSEVSDDEDDDPPNDVTAFETDIENFF